MRKMKMSDIIIPAAFARTTPKREKVQKCKDYWLEHRSQTKLVKLSKGNVLVDGYAQYLALRDLGVDEVIVQGGSMPKEKKSELLTGVTYVYGRHMRKYRLVSKEYVWQADDKLASVLNVGDGAWVVAKGGIAPIVITRIERMNHPPIDGVIDRVVSKIKERQDEERQ